jgi:phosphohistidine phosphatase
MAEIRSGQAVLVTTVLRSAFLEGKKVDLILWRHADAENGAPDEQRKLTPEGHKQARRMAAWLKKHLPEDATVIVSTARRAQETAMALTKEFTTSAAVGTAAGASAVLEAAGWPGAKGAVVVVGHQPTLGQAAALALTGKALEWSTRKGAIWWLTGNSYGDVTVQAVLAPELL